MTTLKMAPKSSRHYEMKDFFLEKKRAKIAKEATLNKKKQPDTAASRAKWTATQYTTVPSL